MGQASPAHGEIDQWRAQQNHEVMDTTEQRELEALRFSARASRAIATLESHQKSRVQEYSERKKRLRRIILAIQQREQMGVLQAEGLNNVSLSDDDLALVHNPLRSL